MNEYTPDLYELEDENGEKSTFELIDTMEFEGELYYALCPFFDETQGEELLQYDGEVVILKSEYDESTGEEILVTIEDDDEYDKVGEEFMKRIEEMYELEEEEENPPQ